uniref:Uncharacterized protein n=1 Tax=Octopus bimaculoides TaxID=37653 RepID=A0A0L8HSL3_OCTBM
MLQPPHILSAIVKHNGILMTKLCDTRERIFFLSFCLHVPTYTCFFLLTAIHQIQ